MCVCARTCVRACVRACARVQMQFCGGSDRQQWIYLRRSKMTHLVDGLRDADGKMMYSLDKSLTSRFVLGRPPATSRHRQFGILSGIGTE